MKKTQNQKPEIHSRQLDKIHVIVEKNDEKKSKSYYIYPKSQACDRTELKSKEVPEARKAEVINYRGQRKGALKILEESQTKQQQTEAHAETYLRGGGKISE